MSTSVEPLVIWRRIARACRYLFVKRMAIKPFACNYCHGTGYCGPAVCSCYMLKDEQIKIYEWQQMPDGFRWV